MASFVVLSLWIRLAAGYYRSARSKIHEKKKVHEEINQFVQDHNCKESFQPSKSIKVGLTHLHNLVSLTMCSRLNVLLTLSMIISWYVINIIFFLSQLIESISKSFFTKNLDFDSFENLKKLTVGKKKSPLS